MEELHFLLPSHLRIYRQNLFHCHQLDHHDLLYGLQYVENCDLQIIRFFNSLVTSACTILTALSDPVILQCQVFSAIYPPSLYRFFKYRRECKCSFTDIEAKDAFMKSDDDSVRQRSNAYKSAAHSWLPHADLLRYEM